jgi:phosphoribosylformylglycinamidine synthase
MAACGEPGEDAALFETVQAVTRDFCPQLNLAIPVGKDSLSMRTMWQSPDTATRTQVAPLSLVISAFAPVPDVSLSITPDLKPGASRLALVDLSQGRNRLGGSILAQVHSQLGDDAPDIEDTSELARFYDTVQALLRERKLLAYHDRSDGGVVVTLAEMAMAGGRGVDAALPETTCPLAALFNEEAGAVLQIAERDAETVRAAFAAAGLAQAYHELGKVRDDHGFRVSVGTLPQIESDLTNLRRLWSSTSLAMRSLRDNPEFAQSEHEAALDANDPGMTFRLSYDVDEDIAAPFIASGSRPRLAILREQGTYGQNEMAAAFTLAGFEAVDVHMSDLIGAAAHLADFKGLVACAGASFGGALGAGAGWAGSILANPALAEMFGTFFARGDSFALGVGDGCQMLSRLASLIPGAEHWPRFDPNASDSFEGRYTTVEVMDSPSVLLRGMAGSRLPIAVAHAEGRAVFVDRQRAQLASRHAALRFVDNTGAATERYPFNPNGTEGGLTGFTAADGRVTIMMPLPERGFRSLQLSYRPAGQFVGEAGPWMRLFRNARHFVG